MTNAFVQWTRSLVHYTLPAQNTAICQYINQALNVWHDACYGHMELSDVGVCR
jgi:hypothetical protein